MSHYAKALMKHVQDALTSHCHQICRFISDNQDTFVEQRREFRKRRHMLFTWFIDLYFIRYIRFRVTHERNEKTIRGLERALPAKIRDSYSKFECECNEIEQQYEREIEGFSNRQKQIEQNHALPEDQRIKLDWSWFDRTTREKIESGRRESLNNVKSEVDFQISTLKGPIDAKRRDAAQYRTNFWLGEAECCIVPLPRKDEEGMWGQQGTLTAKGEYTVRTLVRRERRERWESVQIRIAFILSILMFGLSVWNAINHLNLGSPTHQIAASSAED